MNDEILKYVDMYNPFNFMMPPLAQNAVKVSNWQCAYWLVHMVLTPKLLNAVFL